MWFALRVTYGRELKFQKSLQEASFETFVPMKKKKFEKEGKEYTKIVPAVSNLCFVNSEKGALDAFLNNQGPDNIARYIWDRATGNPAIVPQKAMESFMKVCSVMSDDVLYINAHGTGTALNDTSETAAYKIALGQGAYKAHISSI